MVMFDTDWDVDKYKNEFESIEHWELRRQFMEAHKQKYPELRLVCLTQVFFNMEFLGCKYPQETMDMVNKMAGEVAEEFRESRKDKLKRTFVGAQDAAGAKAKGAKPPTGAVEGSEVTDGPKNKKPRFEQDQEIPCIEIKDEDEEGAEGEETDFAACHDDDDGEQYAEALKEIAKTVVLFIPIRGNSKTEGHPMKILNNCFKRSFKHKLISFRISGSKEEGYKCEIYANPTPPELATKTRTKGTLLIASASGSTQRQCKIQAAHNAVRYMKKYCTCIEPNPEWFIEGRTPEFIEKRIPCNKNPRTYLIMKKEDTGHISPEVADLLLDNFLRSSNEDMFFPDNEFLEKEKIQLMNRSGKYGFVFRHFGSRKMLKDHHICISKHRTANEILEQARQLGGKHPKYIIHYKK